MSARITFAQLLEWCSDTPRDITIEDYDGRLIEEYCLDPFKYDWFLDYFIRTDYITLRILNRFLDKMEILDKHYLLKKIAINGNEKILEEMRNHRYVFVRDAIAKRASHSFILKMINDSSLRVKLELARRGYSDICEHLSKDKDKSVRLECIRHLDSEKLIEMTKQETDSDVMSTIDFELRRRSNYLSISSQRKRKQDISFATRFV